MKLIHKIHLKKLYANEMEIFEHNSQSGLSKVLHDLNKRSFIQPSNSNSKNSWDRLLKAVKFWTTEPAKEAYIKTIPTQIKGKTLGQWYISVKE